MGKILLAGAVARWSKRAAVVGGLVVLGATTPIACSGGPGRTGGPEQEHANAGRERHPRDPRVRGPARRTTHAAELWTGDGALASRFAGVEFVARRRNGADHTSHNRHAWRRHQRDGVGVGGTGRTCVQRRPENTVIQLPPWSLSTLFLTSAAGQYPDWYVYGFRVQGNTIDISPLENDCADRLLLEQNLICTADKLAQISDAVGDVVWPAATIGDVAPPTTDCVYGPEDGGIGVGACQFGSQWDIPPQADSDRFIVRDLAIHTLGMIPVLDSYTDIAGQSCATSYADVANGTTGWVIDNSAAGQSVASEVFGVNIGSTGQVYPFFPPSNVPFVDAEQNLNGATIAASALAIEAQVLRSGGRLLHDLIRRDVYSDLASAAQLSAQALDPNKGNQLNWGVTVSGGTAAPPPQPAYGSISHAARVLMGRWEIGDPTDFPTTYQPECEGVSALDLIPGAFGSDLLARVRDLPIQTAGEATASQLVTPRALSSVLAIMPNKAGASSRCCLINTSSSRR